MSFDTLKRSFAAHKGHYNVVPTDEVVKSAYVRLQDRMEKVFTAMEKVMNAIEDNDVDDENSKKESDELIAYHEKLSEDRNGIESLYAAFREQGISKEQVISVDVTKSKKPVVRLTALSPPVWNGVKADFHTWRKKFMHIMKEAVISDSMTQLCYLLDSNVIPKEYQNFICDCSTIEDAWCRLEERVPESSIKHEVIAQLRRAKPLPYKRSVGALRDLANEISLFCRRMIDLNFSKENYTCIVMQDVYEKLDSGTALRYRTQMSLKRELGMDSDEDLKSLSAFLRSEAETLELTMKDSNANVGWINHERCLFCDNSHRIEDCREYMKIKTEDRREFVKEAKLCFICLGKFHFARNCSSKRECSACKGKYHHSSLCLVVPNKITLNPLSPTFNAPENNSAILNQLRIDKDIGKSKDYAPLLLVEVKNRDGNWIRAKCFLDGGSNTSLVRNRFAKLNRLQGSGACNIKLNVAGGGIHKEERSEIFEMEIRSIGGHDSYFITASGIQTPCFNIRPIPEEVFEQYEYLKTAKDNVYVGGGQVDILLGRDYAPLLVDENIIRAPVDPDSCPSLAYTRLGCYLYGGMSNIHDDSPDRILLVNHIDKREENELRTFFYGDILGVKPTSICVCSDNEILESRFIRHMEVTTRMNLDGRVCVRMPWKPGFPDKLPNNYVRAKDQLFKREDQLQRSGKLEEYNFEVQKLEERGVVRRLTHDESARAEEDLAWYLNHRIIERPDKTSSKLRIVFDSASPYKGMCLNDAFEKGPVYTNSLFKCLLKWREDYVAIAGDIEKMFNQVAMSEDDQKYHRFLWRNGSKSEPIIVYQWLRVLFGDKPSPDIAAFALHFLAERVKSKFPRGATILKDETYVDDVITSEKNSSDATNSIMEVDSILCNGKFKIKLWNSNNNLIDQNANEVIVGVLGHEWNKHRDTISLKLSQIDNSDDLIFTKRNMLGQVAKLWDPYGYLLPVTIKYRIDLQKLWQLGYRWDEPLNEKLIREWVDNVRQMQELRDISFERCLKPIQITGLPQLHAFSDGGDDAFVTCIFIRWPTSDGYKTKFIAAKAFVAPLKRKSIPRVELMGAVAMSRIVNETIEALGYEFEYKRFWIDSEVVIYWLFTESNRYKPFVSTRVQEFQDTHPNWKAEIRYVPSTSNSADCLTKPISVDHLSEWHDGKYSSFLETDELSWSSEIKIGDLKLDVERNVLEEKSKPTHKRKLKLPCNARKKYGDVRAVQSEDNMSIKDTAMKYSSWSKLVSDIAFLKHGFENRRFDAPECSTPNCIAKAETYLYHLCQEEIRKDEKSRKRIAKFEPFSDKEMIIRARGRLRNTDVDFKIKHPIILPAEHPVVHIFLTYFHKKLLHQGYRVVMANLMNEGFLIVGGRQMLKSIASQCIFCRSRRRKLLTQMMGEFPSFRLQIRKPPFTSCALDFFGPLKVKYSRNASVNGSVLIITCTTTRCIHLELCLMMDANTFLRAWRRFVTNRGVHPAHVFSDGGTNFVGAQPLISSWINSWDQHLMRQNFPKTAFDFKWKFNVPTASHMNGVVESLVNSVRKALDASMTHYTRRVLNYEEWSTVLAEVTYTINSRPLFPEGDPWDFNCITGNDILHPYGQPSIPQLECDTNENSKDMFKVVQNRVGVFWNTWMKHMPPQLLSRNKWFHPRSNLEIGDFVIVFEKGIKGMSAPRSMWKKAIVTAVHPGNDGRVRSVTIRDSNRAEFKRPIHKLCLIATRAELEK